MQLVDSCIEDDTYEVVDEGPGFWCEEWPSTGVISSLVVDVDEAFFEVVKGIRSFCVLWTMQVAFLDHFRVQSKLLCHGWPRMNCVSIAFLGKTLNS